MNTPEKREDVEGLKRAAAAWLFDLPDRTSPEEYPEMGLVTAREVADFCQEHNASLLEELRQAQEALKPFADYVAVAGRGGRGLIAGVKTSAGAASITHDHIRRAAEVYASLDAAVALAERVLGPEWDIHAFSDSGCYFARVETMGSRGAIVVHRGLGGGGCERERWCLSIISAALRALIAKEAQPA